MKPLFVVGDVHGQFDRLGALLRAEGLIDDGHNWTGGDARLWFMGDFVDRGPGGVDIIELVMQLQVQAQASGGEVGAILGNHEPMLVSARLWGERPTRGAGGSFLDDWRVNGGVESDLERLTERHVTGCWSLPAMARVDDWLFMHADAWFYANFGDSVGEVNASVTELMLNPEPGPWSRFLGTFADRLMFADPERGERSAGMFLRLFGGRQIVHGHTPIPLMNHARPEQIDAPLRYAGGRCINTDAGLFLGAPGFVLKLHEEVLPA